MSIVSSIINIISNFIMPVIHYHYSLSLSLSSFIIFPTSVDLLIISNNEYKSNLNHKKMELCDRQRVQLKMFGNVTDPLFRFWIDTFRLEM